MIFVTVGTHEQPFDRLLEKIDKLKKENKIKDDIFIQTGYSQYKPQYCESKKMIPYDEMKKRVSEARIIITHGGPSSFIMPLQLGKIPIVVPRLSKYGEHVNDHQLDFANYINEKLHNIIVVEDIEKLEYVLNDYEYIINNYNQSLNSNNAKFNSKLESIVENLLESRR